MHSHESESEKAISEVDEVLPNTFQSLVYVFNKCRTCLHKLAPIVSFNRHTYFEQGGVAAGR